MSEPKKILVTGATGFVGRHVVRELVTRGHSVRALVHTPERASVLPAAAEMVEGDVLNSNTLAAAFEGVQAVVHLVAVVRERAGRSFQDVNYGGTANVLQAAEAAGVGRIVHASAMGAGSDPAVRYLYSRWMAEEELGRSELAHTILRFSVAFGPGDEFFNVLAALVKVFPLVPVPGDGSPVFQPIHVQDVARCLALSVEDAGNESKTLDVAGTERFTYDELLNTIASVVGAKIAKVHLPLALVRPAAAVLETLSPRPPVTREQLKMLGIDSVAPPDAVRREFGFEPMLLKENLGFLADLGLLDALRISLGFMPSRVRAH